MQRILGSIAIAAGASVLVPVLLHLYLSRLRGSSKSWVSSIAWSTGDAYKVLFACDLRLIILAAALGIVAGIALWCVPFAAR